MTRSQNDSAAGYPEGMKPNPELKPGDSFEIVEARMSTAIKHEDSDFIPFLRSRNHEVLMVPTLKGASNA